MLRRENDFWGGEEKIKFILAKLMKNPSIRDFCSLGDIIKERELEHFSIDGLGEYLLDSAKNDKENIEATIYVEVSYKSPISSNKIFEVLMTQNDKSEQQESHLKLKQLP